MLSPEEKLEKRFKSCLSAKGIEFNGPQAERTYKERLRRIIDAIQLKVPDRVPVYPSVGFFPAYYAGITYEEAMYNYEKLRMAWKKYALDFAPDLYPGTASPGSGKAFEILDYRLYRWPGHGTPTNTPYQYVEGEYMKDDEYDALIQDPSGFWMKVYLPRIFGALDPLKRLSLPAYTVELPFTGAFLGPYGTPEVQNAFEALFKAGQEVLKWRTAVGEANREIMESGFPILSGGVSKAPFDTIGDTLRGTREIMFDMFRQTDKLLEALERITPTMIEMGILGARASSNPLIFIPLHKGADGFMSDEQYKTFYWPTLKEVILGLIEEGLVPYVFAEGSYNTRLEIIRDLPKGKVIWKFDGTDMARAKEILGDVACIEGNVPQSLLATGTPRDVKEYCKRLIQVAGKDGGFILSTGAAIDRARPENVHAMIETAKEYGVYG